MASYTRESLYRDPNNAKEELKDAQVVSLINMLYGKQDYYKKILYHNESILPSERKAFENYIETKKMQKDLVFNLLKGYFLYSVASHQKTWFKLTSRMNNNIFIGCLMFYVKLTLLYAKNAEEIRFTNKNFDVIKSSIMEKIDEIEDLSLEKKSEFIELMNTNSLINKYEQANSMKSLNETNEKDKSNLSENIA